MNQCPKTLFSKLTTRVCLSILLVSYFAISLPIATTKSLGNDEIYSLQVAMQGGWQSIWSALVHGADNHPPLDYYTRHLFITLFGPSELSVRLPSILAVGAGAIFIFDMFRRSYSPIVGMAASVLTLINSGLQAAETARSYAFLYLSFALSLYAWDRIANTPRTQQARRLWLLFSLALVLGIYSHYYAVLYLAAFGAAVFFETCKNRRISCPPVLAMSIAVVFSVPLWPLIHTASQFSANFWTPVTLTALLRFYPDLLLTVAPCLIALLSILCLVPLRTSPDELNDTHNGLNATTVVALVAFAMLPLVLFVLAKVFTGAFLPRYVEASGTAICLLAVVMIERLAIDRGLRALVLVVSCR